MGFNVSLIFESWVETQVRVGVGMLVIKVNSKVYEWNNICKNKGLFG